jgi:hypothetical protein
MIKFNMRGLCEERFEVASIRYEIVQASNSCVRILILSSFFPVPFHFFDLVFYYFFLLFNLVFYHLFLPFHSYFVPSFFGSYGFISKLSQIV